MFIRSSDATKSFGTRKVLRPAVGTNVETGTVVAWYDDGSYEVAGAMDNFLIDRDGSSTRLS